MSEGPFRSRGLEVVVDTTKEAEFDFASHKLTAPQLAEIAENLRALPISKQDRTVGDLRFRDVLEDREVAYIITHEGSTVAILIFGLDYVGKLESSFEVLTRAGVASLPAGAQELLKGRKKKV